MRLTKQSEPLEFFLNVSLNSLNSVKYLGKTPMVYIYHYSKRAQTCHLLYKRQGCFSDLSYYLNLLNLLNSLKALLHLVKTPLSCVYTEGQHWRFWISPEPIRFLMLVFIPILTLGVNVTIQINVFFPSLNVKVNISINGYARCGYPFRVWPQKVNETALFPTW